MNEGIEELVRAFRAELVGALDALAREKSSGTAGTIIYVPAIKAGAYIVTGDAAEAQLRSLYGGMEILCGLLGGKVSHPTPDAPEPSDLSRN